MERRPEMLIMRSGDRTVELRGTSEESNVVELSASCTSREPVLKVSDHSMAHIDLNE
jgi:hypothetical protein